MQGKIVNSRYQIISKLGGGGFGETYQAIDQWQNGDNRCVVKQLKPNIINKFTLRLFELEAQILFKLGSHDQIPQLLAHFQQDEEFYLVQEFIDGHDLTQEIKAGECWDETEVIKLLQEILEVLASVHQNHVIHRDIKPANIMRRLDGKIVLIDFGGVKQLTTENSSTVSTHVVGTPGYMPQEQINNQAQLCSDIYAVGMLAISALTGWKPNELPTDPKTLQLLWRDKAQVNHRLADVLDKMVRFHFAERYQSATEALDAVNSTSYTAFDWCDRGEKLYELRRYQEALTAFELAIELQQNYPQAWAGCGWALQDLGRYDEALAACSQAMQLKSDYHKAWTGRAVVYSSLGKHDEALINYDQAIEFKSDDYHAWSGRAWVLRELKRYDEALTSCDQALEIKPNYAEALINRTWVLFRLERKEEALAACHKAVEIQPDNFKAWNLHGLLLLKLQRHEEAITSFEKAIQIKPDYSTAWYHRCVVLHNLGKYYEAVASFDKAIQYQPEDFFTWMERGKSLRVMGLYHEAIASFDQALRIEPNYKLAIENRKLAQQELRNQKLLSLRKQSFYKEFQFIVIILGILCVVLWQLFMIDLPLIFIVFVIYYLGAISLFEILWEFIVFKKDNTNSPK